MSNLSEEFFRELDRRIESPDSPHPEDSKERLRAARVSLAILAAGDPQKFEQVVGKVFAQFEIPRREGQPK